VHDNETLISNNNAQQRGDEKHQGVKEAPRLEAFVNKQAHRWQQGNVNKHEECTTKRHWWIIRAHNNEALMGNKSAQQEVLTSTKRTQQRSVAKQQECATHKGGVDEHQKCTSRMCRWTSRTHIKEVLTINKSAQQGGADE
jgi:hypothetical protein